MQARRSEFHTIDALRFFAFLRVYLHHLYVPGDFGLFTTLKKGGGIGVVFFFVLSGFLITWILTSSKIQTDKIDLRRFYAKRVLRIWPLFYVYLLIVYLAPHGIREYLGYDGWGYTPDWRASFAFLENYQMILHHSVPAFSALVITWSLCVEEHFYIVWALLMVICPVRRIPLLMVGLMATAVVARIATLHYLPAYEINTNEIVTSMDYFACGGVIGYLVAAHRDRFEAFILDIPYWIRVGYCILALVIFLRAGSLFAMLHLPEYLYPLVEAAVFAGLIAVVIPAGSDIRISTTSPLSYLGRISYGLYLFHTMAIVATLKIFDRYHIRIDTVPVLCLDILITFSLSVLVAAAFYHFFEKPILGLKKYL